MSNSKQKRFKELGSNTLWMIIGNFASKFLSFVLVPLYTNYLTTSEYGISDIITTTVNLLLPLLTLSIYEGVLRFTLEKNINKKNILTLSLCIDFIGFFLLFAFTPFVIRIVSFKDYYGYFLCFYLAMALNQTLQQFAKGLNRIKVYVLSGILNTICVISSNIYLIVYLKQGIEGYLTSYIFGMSVSVLFLCFTLKIWTYFTNPLNIPKNLVKRFLAFCWPLIPNSLSWWVNNSSDRYILNYLWGASLTGIYSVSYKIPSVLSIISSIFTSALQISVVEDFGSKESEEFFSDVYNTYFNLMIFVALLLIILIKPIAYFMFLKDFYIAWKYSSILIVAVLFQALGGVLGTVYTGAMKTKEIFITTLIGAVVNLVLNFILIPYWGAYGAAIATLFSYFLIWIIRIIDSRKLMKIKHSWGIKIVSLLILFISMVINYFPNIFYSVNIVLLLLLFYINRKTYCKMFQMLKHRNAHGKN